MQPLNSPSPDETLAADIMPLLLGVVAVLSCLALGLLMIVERQDSPWPYLLTGGLIASSWLGVELFRRKRLRLAGEVICHALVLLPLLSITSFGVAGNTLPYLASVGVLAAGPLIGPPAPLRLAWRGLAFLLALLIVPLLLGSPIATLSAGLAVMLTMTVLLLSTAALSWVAVYAVNGTIGWAVETAQKSERREQLLREAQAELERSVRERDLLNDRLYRLNLELEAARADAEAAYRSKASFMATMSHELRTPLNIIIGFSSAMIDHPEMYEGAPPSPAVVADLSEIRRSGQHLLGLINDILDLAKVEAGRLDLNRVALPLMPLLDEMMRTASGLLKDRPVLLRREYASPLPTILADETRIRQVLLNLVSNACKFTSMGEVGIGARADNYEVVLWVRDTGIGIAEADQLRIFNQFEQVESHDAKQYTGTGLGLSICRWLVELHGGRMWLESELGKGSIFYFTLPRSTPIPDRDDPGQPRLLAEGPASR